MSSDLNVDKLLAGLRARRTDPETGLLIKEALAKSLPDSPAKAYKYLCESMEAVPDDYTHRTFRESNRIQKQLIVALLPSGFDVEFAHQGSVTNNTHIKIHSDIDLLVCTKVFCFLEPPLVPTSLWSGNPVDYVSRLRAACATALQNAYEAADVDTSGPKALSISGGSLRRKIDVVPGTWLHNTESFRSGSLEDRGVQILDAKSLQWIRNYPFHHNRCIHAQDLKTSGNLRRLIRFFKSLRADAEIGDEFKSYDIAGLCYNIPVEKIGGSYTATQLIEHAVAFAVEVYEKTTLRSSLWVPNGTRKVFEESREKAMLADLMALIRGAWYLTQLAERRRAA